METKTMTKIFVARMLGSETSWNEGDNISFTVTYKYPNNKWEMTLRREEAQYAPFKFSLNGVKILHNGKPTEYKETHARRYKCMEAAFLHIINHLNDNANVYNRYKTIDQWLNENESELI